MDELIVDGKNVLEPVNLEENKREIMEQRKSVPSEVSLTHFKEHVGIFRANAKGDDLNNLVTKIQSSFSDINTHITNLYDNIDTVFKTTESIHKDSIGGIIVAIKSAQEAIEQAEYAIEQIESTLLILQNFKKQLEENTKHLNDIDIIWNSTEQLNIDVSDLKKRISDDIDLKIESLNNFKSSLDEIKHLHDVDAMYVNLASLKNELKQEKLVSRKRLSGIEESIACLQNRTQKLDSIVHLDDLDTMHQDLYQLQGDFNNLKENQRIKFESFDEFKSSIEKIEHIEEVDELWDNYENIKATAEKAESLSVENSKCSAEMTARLNDLDEYRDKLISYAHLNEVDNTWEDVQKINDFVNEIKDDLQSVSVLKNEVAFFRKQLKTMYFIVGGVAGLVILQFILNVVGVL